MHQVPVFAVPAALILLQLFAGAELFPDAEHTGEDALRRDFQIGSQEGMPVEIVRRSALEAENVINGGDHEIEVLLPVDERRLFFPLLLLAAARVHKIDEGLERGFGIRWAFDVEHPEQGFGLIRVGEIRVVEHHEDLEDRAEVGANRVFFAGDDDGCG